MNSTKTHWSLIYILWFSGIGAALQFAKISVGFNELQAFYQSDERSISFVLSITGLAGLLFGASASLLAQYWGYKKSLLTALLLASVLSLFEATLPSLPVLLGLRFLEGLTHLAIVVTAPTLMSAAAAPQQRSMVMSLWGTFFGVAFSLANAFLPYWIARYGMSELFIAHGILMLLLSILLAYQLPSQLIEPSPITLSMRNILIRHKQIYGHLSTALPSFIFICYASMYVALLTFAPQLGKSPDWVMTALPLLSISGAFVASSFNQSGFFKPYHTVQLAFTCVLLALMGLFIMHQTHHSLDFFKMILFFTLGLQQGSIYGIIPYLAKEPQQQAQSIAAIAQTGNLGSTIGPPLFAYAWLTFATLGLISLGILITSIGFIFVFYVFKKIELI